MKLVDGVYELSESFMKNPQYVALDHDRIKEVSKLIVEKKFPIPKVDNAAVGIILELVAASINYCYWYGKSDVRPNGANSTLMYEIMMNSFYDFRYPDTRDFKKCIDRLCSNLAIYRFPLLEERISHLYQLLDFGLDFCIDINTTFFVKNPEENDKVLEYFLDELVASFPGFASDMFLKRASLFFLQLNRRFGIFADEISHLPVPADYQVPKMLEHYGCIKYNRHLKDIINSNQLIPKNSLQECEIRSATILVIKELCDITGFSTPTVDGFFFLNRYNSKDKFHLTITTDY